MGGWARGLPQGLSLDQGQAWSLGVRADPHLCSPRPGRQDPPAPAPSPRAARPVR